MKLFHTVLKVLRDIWGPTTGLPPELERYCRDEGVDPWTLAEALRVADARESFPVQTQKKEAPTVEMTAGSPLPSAVG